MRVRFLAALAIATLSWIPLSVHPVAAIYCYSGDPPAVYQACLAYNGGIGQQVNNQNQLQNIQSNINNALTQINAIDTLIANLKSQIAAQEALIAQTQAAIDDLNRQIRFGEANLTRLVASTSVRDQLLNERLRYIDSYGALNYVQLILTASSFNQMMDRMIAAQQIAASDRQLLTDLAQQHSEVALANTALDDQKTQVTALLEQQKATEVDLQNNVKAQAAALAAEQLLEVKLSAQYAAVEAERAAIDAQVAQLAVQYQAAAAKAGGGSGVFEWPLPACGPSCISQRFGCSTFYLEVYDPNCPWPNKIHTGIDIAGPYGTNIVAADTGVVYLYPGSIGYGNLLVMFHGNGYSTYYGHTASYAPGLYSGEVVGRGTTIAFEGSTGWSTGPHLHFEIRVNGVYKDPCIWLGC
ncbi:MAG TPA: peptidoglycan DD-metalloendopeptidase family protein [Candidatus Acidoferrum sp.]|jgi:murein DD-endopeptidase MepM/ murein hydrolase activator NlpD|nr:peptidoglycan DD-metalloendopeptidase family protein [Candidatus Acidoferrum sp.]